MKELFLKISNNIVKYCFAFFCALYAISNILFTYWINNLSYYEKSINVGVNIFNVVLLVCFFLVLYFLVKKNFFNIKEKYLLFGFLLLIKSKNKYIISAIRIIKLFILIEMLSAMHIDEMIKFNNFLLSKYSNNSHTEDNDKAYDKQLP